MQIDEPFSKRKLYILSLFKQMALRSDNMKQRVKLCYILLWLTVPFLLSQCRKESSTESLQHELHYEPFGKNFYATAAVGVNNQKLFTVLNGNILAQYNATAQSTLWTLNFDYSISGLVHNKDGSAFVMETQNEFAFNESIEVYHVDAQGIRTKLTELMPDHHHLKPFLLGAESDGANGFYALVLMEDYNYPPSPAKRFLVHFNQGFKVDQRIELFPFYMYINTDEQGNLYLTQTLSSIGAPMQLRTSKLDRDELIFNNKVKAVWSYNFQSNEPDWKWTRYLPFKLRAHDNRITVIKQHNTGVNEMSSGVDVLHINAQNGAELSSYFIPFEFEVNNYNNQSSFHYLPMNQNDFISLNFGRKSKCVYYDPSGKLLWQSSLSGDNNRSYTTGLGIMNNRIHVFGFATLMKSPSSTPFVFIPNIP